jgi:nitroimidazol reductase NimA-like FMN-containing flavoprotein (pyridoxamine 5'-phosphate oxidase superfamily)
VFRKIKLKERAISDDKALEILINGSYGVLSTIGEDGYPYGVPVNHVYFENGIYFHCALEGHKLENIQFTEKVSFCVVSRSDILAVKFDTDYESVIAFGKASEVTEHAGKEAVLLALVNKYSGEHLATGKNYIKKFWDEARIFKIEIEHLSGKAYT